MRDNRQRDRAVGALLGLAVGDALGTTLEFARRDSRPHHSEMIGGGPFDLAPGQWTDDTAMALALAASLIERGSFDPDDVARRFLAWWREGAYSCTGSCFDIGITTREALARIERGGGPWGGSTSEQAAGNGSLMRLAPAALHAFAGRDAAANPVRRETSADELARAQSCITHAAPQALDACGWFARLIVRAIADGSAPRPEELAAHKEVAAVAAGSWRGKARDAISSSGYVVHTLEAALWAVESTNTFEEALVLAVNLADDADTVGAVAGQLAGALYGASAIPQRWLAPLAWRERIEATALQLTAF